MKLSSRCFRNRDIKKKEGKIVYLRDFLFRGTTMEMIFAVRIPKNTESNSKPGTPPPSPAGGVTTGPHSGTDKSVMPPSLALK